jgi:hypothetical protein
MRKGYTLKNVLKKKIREPRIIYLLGGGASFCAGLPGLFRLTELVQSGLDNTSSSVFDEIMQSLVDNNIENPNIEEVLSELYHRLTTTGLGHDDKEQLKTTLKAICQCIQNNLKVDGSSEYHKEFLQRLVSRREAEPTKKAPPVQIFTTNYDLLIELACEELRLVLINGFEGVFHRCWNPGCFDYDVGKTTTHPKTPRFEPSARHIRLYKLHGSLSWFKDNAEFYEEKPSSMSSRIPLIIYPSRLKYTESIRPPFDWLFRRFSDAVSKAKLLICIGYRFADKHLNQYIDIGLNNGLSLLVFSKEPIDALVNKSTFPQVSILNEETTIINGINQNEVNDLWDFKKFAKWLPALKEK